MRKGILLMLVALVALSAPMFGSVLIDFSGAVGGGGTISLSGTTVTGTNIKIGAIDVEGAPDPTKNGIYNLTNGLLNFSFTGSPSSGATSITITATAIGTCVNNGGGTCSGGQTTLSTDFSGPGPYTLLTGTSPDSFTYSVDAGNVISVHGSGADTKNTTMLADLGLAGTTWSFGGFSIGGLNTGANTWKATSTDIGNNTVPEPTSVLLLGTVLLGVTHVIRRRAKKA